MEEDGSLWKSSMIIIGRKDKVDFLELGLYDIDAKVDTGAYISAIHCHDIMEVDEAGASKVRFRLLDPSRPSYNNEEYATAIKAAKVLGLNIAGVDMLQAKRGSLIMEVNSSPGLEGIEKATNIDIAGKIIEFIERNVGNREMIKDRINV